MGYSVNSWYDSGPDPFNPIFNLYNHITRITVTAKHERRKGFIFHWWGCDDTTFSFFSEIHVSNNYGSPVSPLFTLLHTEYSNSGSECEGGGYLEYIGAQYSAMNPISFQVNTSLVWLDFTTPSGQLIYHCGI